MRKAGEGVFHINENTGCCQLFRH